MLLQYIPKSVTPRPIVLLSRLYPRKSLDFSSIVRSSIATYEILAVFMKSDSFARPPGVCRHRYADQIRAIPWPSRFVSMGHWQGQVRRLRP